MKVRIAFSLGTAGLGASGGGSRSPGDGLEGFGALVDDLERLGFDSLWLSERVTGPAPDPLAAMAFAAGRTTKLKFGTSVLVVPGRNPMLLAKELATIDRLSNGRLLPAVGLGAPDPMEHQAFGVRREERAALFDEVLPLLRRLWSEDVVDHDGPRYTLRGASVLPKPAQQPIDVWLGGIAPSELRRVGRLGDGWLPSFVTPADAAAKRPVVEEAAAAAGRSIDPEHWGALIAYSHDGSVPERLRAFVEKRNPGIDPGDLVPVGHDALRAQCERFVDAGFSKLVVLPLTPPADWTAELEALATTVLPLTT
jgi:probable F420-dependent oxidoreductase